MRDTIELPEEVADQLQRLRARLGRLERRAVEDEAVAGQVRRLHALIDHLEHRTQAEDEQSMLEEQQLLAEVRLGRLRRHLEALDAKLAAEQARPEGAPALPSLPAGDAAPAADGAPSWPLAPGAENAQPDSPPVPEASRNALERQESRPLSIAISLAVLAVLAALTLVLTPIPAHP